MEHDKLARRPLYLVSALLFSMVPAAVAAETGNGQAQSVASVSATANVTVSDGTEFRAEMKYSLPLQASYSQHFPDVTMHFETDGEAVFVRRDDTELSSFPEGLATWILGHQFHAQLSRFAEINGGIVQILPYDGEGDCPCTEYRGRLSSEAMDIEGYGLAFNDETRRPQRFFVHRRAESPVVSRFEDWRIEGDRETPYRIVVDDGEQVYDFRFTAVEYG
jgi:hypothetical protein